MIALGRVNEEELKEIEMLFRRKSALENMFIVLAQRINDKEYSENSNSMYEKLVTDLGITNQNMGQWWMNTSAKYKSKVEERKKWTADLGTGVVSLLDEEERR